MLHTRTSLVVSLVILLSVCDVTVTHARRLPRVRAVDAAVVPLLARGYRQSITFRALVDALERSDVIVHVLWRQLRRGPARGTLHFVSQAGGYRYLRITLDGAETPNAIVALLGHELQHAAEVVGAPWVTDEADFAALYHSIGHPSCATEGHCFDTTEAWQAGRTVLRELLDRGRNTRSTE